MEIMFHSKKDKAMKKTYITPSTEVVILKTKSVILTGSETKMFEQNSMDNISGDSRGFGFGGDEEE
jgi:hypothetical protein